MSSRFTRNGNSGTRTPRIGIQLSAWFNDCKARGWDIGEPDPPITQDQGSQASRRCHSSTTSLTCPPNTCDDPRRRRFASVAEMVWFKDRRCARVGAHQHRRQDGVLTLTNEQDRRLGNARPLPGDAAARTALANLPSAPGAAALPRPAPYPQSSRSSDSRRSLLACWQAGRCRQRSLPSIQGFVRGRVALVWDRHRHRKPASRPQRYKDDPSALQRSGSPAGKRRRMRLFGQPGADILHRQIFDR